MTPENLSGAIRVGSPTRNVAPGHTGFMGKTKASCTPGCSILATPGDPDHEEYLQWHGGPFDRGAFDLELVMDDLLRYQRWSRDRLLPWNA